MGAPSNKESRTERLLRILNVPDDFKDPTLPSETFSNSQYNAYLACGKAYEFKYVDKFEIPEFVTTATGSLVHLGAETLNRAKMNKEVLSLPAVEALVSDSCDERTERITDWGEDRNGVAMTPGKMKDHALQQVRVYYSHVLPYVNPVAVEKGFAKKLGDVPVIGYIDLIDEVPALRVQGMTPEEQAASPKVREVVDLKTTRAKWSEHDVKTDVQMTLYSHVEATPRVRIDQIITGSRGVTYVPAPSTRDNAAAEVMIEHYNEVADLIRRGIFPKTAIDSWACNKRHCSFWHLCRGKYNP